MAKLPPGYRIKNGKVIKTQPRKSVSQQIADRKRPPKKFVRVQPGD